MSQTDARWSLWVKNRKTRDAHWMWGDTPGVDIWEGSFAEAESLLASVTSTFGEEFEYEIMPAPRAFDPAQAERDVIIKWLRSPAAHLTIAAAGGGAVSAPNVGHALANAIAANPAFFGQDGAHKNQAPDSKFDKTALLDMSKESLVDLLICEREWMLAFKEDAAKLLAEKLAAGNETAPSKHIFAGVNPRSAESHLRSHLCDLLESRGAESAEDSARRLVKERNTYASLAKESIEVVERIRSVMDLAFTADHKQLMALMQVLDSTDIGAMGGRRSTSVQTWEAPSHELSLLRAVAEAARKIDLVRSDGRPTIEGLFNLNKALYRLDQRIPLAIPAAEFPDTEPDPNPAAAVRGTPGKVEALDVAKDGTGPWKLFLGAYGVACWPSKAADLDPKGYAMEVARCVKEALANSESGPVLAPALDAEGERLALWAHVVSEHSAIMPPDFSMEELLNYHTHEHKGPGTIRNHEESSRTYSLRKIGEVLLER